MKPRTYYRVETWSRLWVPGWRFWSHPRTLAAARKSARAAARERERVRIVEVRERLVPVAGRGRQ